jgi:hypothetical protein
MFKLANDTNDFVECWNDSEKHGALHLLVIGPPGGKMVWGWNQSECAGAVCAIVHPALTEENLTVLRNALKQGNVGHGSLPHSGLQQTAKIVVVTGHAQLSGFVGRPECLLMKK